MREKGQATPLDIYPELDRFEESVYNRYRMISRLRSGDYVINSQDYLASFELFGLDLELGRLLLPIFISVDFDCVSFSQQLRDKKQKQKSKK